ncbi:MAG: C-terminal binding protein [Carbonactinosporaceae bacterium]
MPGQVPGNVVAVLGTRYQDLAIEEAVLRPLGVRLVTGAGQDAEAVVAAAAGADVILAGSGPRFDAAVLTRLSCRGIVRYGVGTDSIDLGAAARAGIWVARVADYGTEAVAVHALTLALAAIRRLPEADAVLRRGGWGFAALRPLHLPSAMTAGVVGFGRIGRRTAGLFAGLGFRTLAYDPYVPVAPGDSAGAPVVPASLPELLGACDVVSLHAPGGSGDAPLLDAAALDAMRPGAALVNTARGSLIDMAALVAGLRRNRPRIAALDVFPAEPVEIADFPPDVADRLILTPHMAWYTEESEADLRTKAAQEAARLLRGEPPRDVVVDPGTPQEASPP